MGREEPLLLSFEQAHGKDGQMPGLRVLMVASEAVPFAKEGGLGDVVGVLPKALARRGHDVRVVIPRYYSIDKDRYGLRRVGGPLGVPMGIIGTLWGALLGSELPASEVPIYFIEYDQYFGRAGGLYSAPDGRGYMDNDNRFVFLSRAALSLCQSLDFRPDIIHVHDWQTAAIPVFLNALYRRDPLLGGAATLLTIHNMQHQGSFYAGLMEVLGVGWEHFNFLELEHHGQTNLLKGGLYHSTLLNAVSPTYAQEIQSPAYGYGLDGVMSDRSADLCGILNGIDYDEWDPEADPQIPATYSSEDLGGKAVCKRSLQQELGLPERPEVPLLGMVTRLVDQKGIDVLAQAMPRILGLDLQFVLLGSGEVWAHFFFGGLAARHPGKLACRIGFDNGLAHRIEAGADFFVMPSRFEPCGLNQMYSLRYGTLPIVRAVGGLNDTVENFDEKTRGGTGFKFYDLTAGALFDTIGWAVHTYYNDKEAIHTLTRRAMGRRWTWDESAEKYEDLYREAARMRTA